MGSSIQMFATVAPADAVAVIDVPDDGLLLAVDWSVAPSGAVAADIIQAWSLAFGSTNSHNSNDARGVISMERFYLEFGAAAAMSLLHLNKYVFCQNLKVNAGERIFMHATGTATIMVVNAILYFDFEQTRRAERRR